MARNIIKTAIYYRKYTEEEVALGFKRGERFFIKVPVKDVFLGVTDTCSAVLKPSIIGQDGLRYYFECVNFTENL